MSFHGRLLIDTATINLNYGQRYGLLGDNGSGKTTFLAALADRDVEIPDHIDIHIVSGEAEPSDVNAVDYIVKVAKQKVAKLEKEIEELSVADNIDEVALEMKYEELEELDPSTFETKAGMILHGLGFSPEMMKSLPGTCLVVGGCVLRSPRRSSSSRTCCCSTSPPTTWTGSRRVARGVPLHLQSHSGAHLALGRLHGLGLHQHPRPHAAEEVLDVRW